VFGDLAVAIFIVCGLVEWISQQSRTGDLGASRPDMKVAADGASLRVENLGAPAKFEAKLLVLEEKNWAGMRGAPFVALWGKTRRAYSDIPQHGHDHIILGDAPGIIRR
jgi:hypothetical protein